MRKPTADHLSARFEAPAPLTVGVEDELMLLDAETLDLAPRAADVIEALGGDPRFTLELPASQVEIVLPPLAGAAEAHTALLEARCELAAACEPLGLRVAGAGVHPFAARLGELNRGGRYERILAEHGDAARRQLVFALQVHVCVRPADVAMHVYNHLRPYLPLVAALAANAPLYEGRDTGLASVRPTISELLPRQGMPPALTWESYAEEVDALADPALWWWELRPHPQHGTLEVRVPDTQATVAESAAVVAVVHALVAALREAATRHRLPPGSSSTLDPDSRGAPKGDTPQAWAAPRGDTPEAWAAPRGGTPQAGGDTPSSALPPAAALSDAVALAADRELAYRHGVRGPLAPRVLALLDALEPFGERLGCTPHLATARAMAESGGGAERQRVMFERGGARAAVEDLVDRFLED